ncbi:MAG: ribonuclease III [Parcubacteria group bacterium]|nr:ribonuclease III [Parcubacteria group bacterium]
MKNVNNSSDIEQKINIRFKNKDLLKQVFVHRSYLNENPNLGLTHNERLEFLGDAVLELIITEYLYINYPNPEGELTNWRSALVKGKKLAEVSKKIGLNDHLLLSRGESKSLGKAREIILANALEALIGAIYLDQGYNVAKKFILSNLVIYLSEILEKELYKDAKSHFQELAQEKTSITPSYNVLNQSGPDHAKIFEIGLFLNDKLIAKGRGASKQEAEQAAAEEALSTYFK